MAWDSSRFQRQPLTRSLARTLGKYRNDALRRHACEVANSQQLSELFSEILNSMRKSVHGCRAVEPLGSFC